MGGLLSRVHAHGETEFGENGQVSTSRRYGYPPSDGGAYFATHYHLGHRKFETGDPELFLFGELNDINFLNTKPVTFPYKQSSKNQPVKCLRSFINVHRDSVKLKKCEGSTDVYTLEFQFDTDVDCRFTVYTKVPDSVEPESLRSGSYSGEGVGVSRSFHYSAGADQRFKEEHFTIRPDNFEDQLTYDPENEQRTFPVVILMETDNPQAPENHQQAHLSICNFDRVNGNGYSIKTLKQKLIVEGVEYLLQEIYGIENKAPDEEPQRSRDDLDSDDEDGDDIEELGAECVICISDVRDTLLLPCRHLCLCSACAANLRYQSSNCPVCRAPFRALLQIQALQPLDPDELIDDDELTGNPKYSTPGYRSVPLLQALNGYNLERDDVGPEPQDVSSQDPPCDDNGEERDREEEENDKYQQNNTTQIPIEQSTTEFCVVVPIEDTESTANSSVPANAPVRTDMTKLRPDSNSQMYTMNEIYIPLPGTPTSDDEQEPTKPQPPRGGQLALNMDSADHSHEVPDSPGSQSSSSRGSTKSTDILLPQT